ncbi:MAG: pilin [Patescibacteria group bacterium]|jgi:hypothetical protein
MALSKRFSIFLILGLAIGFFGMVPNVLASEATDACDADYLVCMDNARDEIQALWGDEWEICGDLAVTEGREEESVECFNEIEAFMTADFTPLEATCVETWNTCVTDAGCAPGIWGCAEAPPEPSGSTGVEEDLTGSAAIPPTTTPPTTTTGTTGTTTATATGALEIQYDAIMSEGLIFANICTDPKTGQAYPSCPCREEGKCDLDDILQVIVNISVFILGISGTVVLCVFIYGGFLFITAQGKPDQVKTGQQALIGAVIGIFIVFASYAIVLFIVSVLKTGNAPGTGSTIEDVIGGSSGTVIDTSD